MALLEVTASSAWRSSLVEAHFASNSEQFAADFRRLHPELPAGSCSFDQSCLASEVGICARLTLVQRRNGTGQQCYRRSPENCLFIPFYSKRGEVMALN